jgi:putative tricarboxylic transport membrane protein
MDVITNLISGFGIILEPMNLLFCFLGVFYGTLIGVLPGLGPVGAMSLLLPVTFKITPLGAIIMLAGIYYGAMYGGSTTSILVNIPGESASVVTCLDGYKMARQGRAGVALGISAIGSFIAGTLSVIGLMLISPPLAKFALGFGPPEYVALMCLGLTTLIYLASGSVLRALMMAVFGIILGCMGQDSATGSVRFGYGITGLMDGIGLAPFCMGLFGISEVLLHIESTVTGKQSVIAKIGNLLPNINDLKQSVGSIIRGTFIGFFLGVLPGGGAVISSFASYAIEKKVSKHPERFGTGTIEGVAGPESANNAAAGAGLIPLLTLGIPTNAVVGLLLGAFMIHGITPGPLLLVEHRDIFWGVVASMYLGNVMLLILNLPLVGLWVKILKIPYRILFPLIVLFCMIGAFSVNNSTFDITIMLLSGVLGYLMRKFRYEGAPLVLAFVLGPMLEYSFKQSLVMSNGSFVIFISSTISSICFSMVLLMLMSALIPGLKKLRRDIPKEETT